PAELRHLRRFLEAVHRPGLRPLQVLEMPVADLYQAHWSITGKGVPDADTTDEAVFLPGRNVLLLAQAMLRCHLRGGPPLALDPVDTNPSPDATPAFCAAAQDVGTRAVNGSVQVLRPSAGLHKPDVMRRGAGLPLGLTFSCIRPANDRHCGRCNKCAERRRAL